MVVLVTDRIYVKTRRLISKLSRAVGDEPIALARVTGFDDARPIDAIYPQVSQFFEGTVDGLAEQINEASRGQPVRLVALNQSAILPTIALQRILGLVVRAGYLESCDKVRTRALLGRSQRFALETAMAHPGGEVHGCFEAKRYIVKPAFGMSSRDVKVYETWAEAAAAAVAVPARRWLPDHVERALGIERSDTRIIEPFIEGTEFSIDGWIDGAKFEAIVQHKLSMVEATFIGDGPTVSPPVAAMTSSRWAPLRTCEAKICEAGRQTLALLGLDRGVFHIEARERNSDRSIQIIEVNPRAPGGSLWRSAWLRTGCDLAG